MSFQTIDALTQDALFGGRVRACAVQQADHFKDDARPGVIALARDVVVGAPLPVLTMIRLTAAAPGIADAASDGDGIHQSFVSDADILAVVQTGWVGVAAIYFDDDGNRKELGT